MGITPGTGYICDMYTMIHLRGATNEPVSKRMTTAMAQDESRERDETKRDEAATTRMTRCVLLTAIE